MASTTPGGIKLTTEHLDKTEQALSEVTSKAGAQPEISPKESLHAPANHQSSHTWLRSLLPYKSLEDLENAWHMGNYVIDRKTGQKTFEEMSIYVRLGMHLLYYGSEQQKALHWKRAQDMLRDQSVNMGKQYDDPQSKDHIQPFIDSFHLASGLPELKEPDPTKYKTFNEFFARELKENARPVAEPENDRVVSSPADCRLTVFPTVDLAKKYWIKGYGFTLAALLGSEQLASQFEDGSIVIARLAPQDYHRWHSPVAGKVNSITDIPGTYYTVNPQAINEAGTLDVFCENKRSVMILQRSSTRTPIAVIAVGAMLVGSIKYNPGIQVDAEVHRGQCLGAFLYGGSTVIVVLPKNEITLDDDLVRNSTEQVCETLVRVGDRIGITPV